MLYSFKYLYIYIVLVCEVPRSLFQFSTLIGRCFVSIVKLFALNMKTYCNRSSDNFKFIWFLYGRFHAHFKTYKQLQPISMKISSEILETIGNNQKRFNFYIHTYKYISFYFISVENYQNLKKKVNVKLVSAIKKFFVEKYLNPSN